MADRRLNCLGEACPIPLVKTQHEMGKMKDGDLLIVDIDHSCAINHIPGWARAAGYNCEVVETGENRWEIHIKRPFKKEI